MVVPTLPDEESEALSAHSSQVQTLPWELGAGEDSQTSARRGPCRCAPPTEASHPGGQESASLLLESEILGLPVPPKGTYFPGDPSGTCPACVTSRRTCQVRKPNRRQSGHLHRDLVGSGCRLPTQSRRCRGGECGGRQGQLCCLHATRRPSSADDSWASLRPWARPGVGTPVRTGRCPGVCSQRWGHLPSLGLSAAACLGGKGTAGPMGPLCKKSFLLGGGSWTHRMPLGHWTPGPQSLGVWCPSRVRSRTTSRTELVTGLCVSSAL